MTELLEKAFAEVSKLAPNDQDAVAQWLLEELASDQAWDATLSRSTEKLSRLAAEALEEHRAGLTEDLDGDSL